MSALWRSGGGPRGQAPGDAEGETIKEEEEEGRGGEKGKGVGAQRGGDVAGVGVGNEGQHLWPCGGLRKVGRFDDGRDVIEVRRPRVAVLELIWTDSVPPLWYEPNRRQLMREENVHATARLVEDCGLVLAVLVAISRGGVRA